MLLSKLAEYPELALASTAVIICLILVWKFIRKVPNWGGDLNNAEPLPDFILKGSSKRLKFAGLVALSVFAAQLVLGWYFSPYIFTVGESFGTYGTYFRTLLNVQMLVMVLVFFLLMRIGKK